MRHLGKTPRHATLQSVSGENADLLADKQAIAITPNLLANKGGLNYAAE
ncbi:hypothetical protein [Cardiobacterium valvarum]|uniref:Uncharacterized protein n=1 Tax=Cardiobacterium valvarum F0432 TaxID=797473 RepID=G9ZEA0_9GAMM|nr:hypothetical protein [Cardiobacterium valvarum]EHM54859.1 hypothetical protein HMPREF9080_01088 [Cardiobacterium valvarum F0432]